MEKGDGVVATVIIPTTATTTSFTATAIFPIPKTRLQNVEEGLRFIISHFDPNEPLWPRTISTHATGGKQIVVNYMQETLTWFRAADF